MSGHLDGSTLKNQTKLLFYPYLVQSSIALKRRSALHQVDEVVDAFECGSSLP